MPLNICKATQLLTCCLDETDALLYEDWDWPLECNHSRKWNTKIVALHGFGDGMPWFRSWFLREDWENWWDHWKDHQQYMCKKNMVLVWWRGGVQRGSCWLDVWRICCTCSFCCTFFIISFSLVSFMVQMNKIKTDWQNWRRKTFLKTLRCRYLHQAGLPNLLWWRQEVLLISMATTHVATLKELWMHETLKWANWRPSRVSTV